MFSRIILVLIFILLTANFLLSLRIGISSHSDRKLVKRQAEVISGLRTEVGDLRTKVEQALDTRPVGGMATALDPPPLAATDPAGSSAEYPPPPAYNPSPGEVAGAPDPAGSTSAGPGTGSTAGSPGYPPVPPSTGAGAGPAPRPVPGGSSEAAAPAAPGLDAPHVTYVQSQYGFIVFNVGLNDGLRVGQDVLIKRQGKLIARAKISTVEPSQAVGDLLPGTLSPGVEVQVGDLAELSPR